MTLRQTLQRSQGFLRDELWNWDETTSKHSDESRGWVERLLARGLGLLQFAVMTAEGFVRHMLLLRATALSYFTVLSLIPIVAVVVAIAGAIGMDSQFEAEIVAKVAAGAPETQAMILDLIRNTKFSALGGVGAIALIVTTIMGISNIERAFNSIWGVTKHRSWGRRFPDYLAVLLVIPLLATGLSIATGLKSQWLVQELLAFPAFELLYTVGLQQLPWLVLSLAFAMMFWFLPNTSVRFTSAALGGVVSAILVLLAQDVYVGYSVGVAKADAVFGTFAQLPLLFFWIYIFWTIVLFGAEIAFAHQHLASYRSEAQGVLPTPAERDAAALGFTIRVAEAFSAAAPAPTATALSESLRVPIRSVRDIADRLVVAGIIVERESPDADAYSLGRPAEKIQVSEVLDALRGSRRPMLDPDSIGERVNAVTQDLETAIDSGPGRRSVADLLEAGRPEPDSKPNADRKLGLA